METPPTRIEELAIRCLEFAPDDPIRAVDAVCAACPGDAAAVRELIVTLHEAGLAAEPVPAPDALRPLDPAQMLGPYRILRQLGSGGMGHVYLAEQTNLGDRKVALKILRPELVFSGRSRERFQREIETLSSLDHPGICQVYDAGEVEGTLLLAMRYLSGETLAEWIARRAGESGRGSGSGLSGVLEQLEIIERVARALHAAHERGLVHRDIKPGNIMLVEGEGPVLLDFGLARSDDHGGGLTMSGDSLGTPPYMAPEQVRGEPVDRRTDVYGLGATLYEAVTFHTPYEAPTRDALYRLIVEGRVPHASSHDRTVPRDVDTVMQTALDPDPGRRYRTALAFAEDLQRIRERRPIVVRRASWVLRTRRWVQRNRAAATTLMVFAVALMAVVGLLLQWNDSLTDRNATATSLRALEQSRKDQRAALQTALESVRIKETVENVSVLHRAFAHAHERVRFPVGSRVRVRLAPDGGSFLIGCSDLERRGWTLRRMNFQAEELCRYEAPHLPSLAHGGDIEAIAFSPSGQRMVTTSLVGDILVWNVATGGFDRDRSVIDAAPEGARIPDRGWGLVSAVFLDEDHILVAEGPSHGMTDPRETLSVRCWRLGEGVRWSRDFEDTRLDAMVASPGWRRMAVAGQMGVAVFDLAADPATPPTPSFAPIRSGTRVVSVALDDRNKRIATATADGRVELWDDSGSFVRRITRVVGTVYCLEFDPTGHKLLVAGAPHAVQVFDLDSDFVVSLYGHDGPVYDAAFGPKGERVLFSAMTACHLNELQVPEAPVLLGHDGTVNCVAAGPGGEWLTTSEDGTALLFDRQGRRVAEMRHGQRVTWGGFTRIGGIRTAAVVMSGVGHPVVHEWSDASGRSAVRWTVEDGHGDVRGIQEHQDGSLLVATATDPHLMRGGRLVEKYPTDDGSPIANALLVPPVGRDVIVVPIHGGQISRAPVDHWDQGRRIVESGLRCRASAVSRDGRILATGHSDGSVRLWDADATSPQTVARRVFRVHAGAVSALAFGPHGRLASGSQDGVLVLWTRDLRVVAKIEAHEEGQIWAVDFSADGRRVASASADRTARVWITDTAELIDLAARRLGVEMPIPR